MTGGGGGGGASSYFKLIFVSVLVITVLCLAGAIYLSLGPQTDPIKATTAQLWTIANTGLGAIFGLIGGKTI